MAGLPRLFRRHHQPPPDCGICGHSQADHYPGCLNVGPAPAFAHCKCREFVYPQEVR